MAPRASSTGLLVLCFASLLLLVPSFADESSAAHDAGRSMTSGGVMDDHSHPIYSPPDYGAVNKIMARGVLVIFCCFFSFLF
ncbi:hypothetical protein SETIT_6G092400v2 [Setaria italica]|nr:hypothetical protein SETIT_6G092400v2 [Setaria italica]